MSAPGALPVEYGSRKVAKRDYCMGRSDQGLKPTCVAKCIAQYMHFGKASEKTKTARERSDNSRVVAEVSK